MIPRISKSATFRSAYFNDPRGGSRDVPSEQISLVYYSGSISSSRYYSPEIKAAMVAFAGLVEANRAGGKAGEPQQAATGACPEGSALGAVGT